MMNNPQDALLQQLDAMSSEARNPDSWDIDLLSSLEIVQRINAEDQTVAHSLQSCLSDVAAVADHDTQVARHRAQMGPPQGQLHFGQARVHGLGFRYPDDI